MLVAKLTAVLKAESGVTLAERLRVQRQPELQPLQGIDRQQPEQVEGQEGQRVAQPGHAFVRLDAGQSVEPVFQRPQPAHIDRQFAGVDARHVQPQRPGQEQQRGQIEADLQIAVARS